MRHVVDSANVFDMVVLDNGWDSLGVSSGGLLEKVRRVYTDYVEQVFSESDNGDVSSLNL